MRKNYLLILFACLSIGASAQWAPTAVMNAVRAEHISANIAGGKVLVAGGWNYTTNLASAEIYDPVADTWTVTGSMAGAHSSGKAVTLNSGKVLVVGGYTGSVNVATAELYDPYTGTWSSAGSMNLGRSYHTATLLQNGKVLVTGGYTGATNLASSQLYDPATNTWSATDSLAHARSYHSAVLLNSGKVLVTGGFNTINYQLSSTEIYDPSTGHWTAGPNLNEARDHQAASKLNNGKVLVSGGRYFNGSGTFAYNGLMSAEIYDPNTNGWSYAAFLNTGISYHEQVTLNNGKVLAVAGVDSSNYSVSSGFTTTASVTQLYDPVADSWSDAAMIKDSRYEMSLILMSNGVALVSGGGGSGDKSAEKYGTPTGLIETAINNGLTISLYPNPVSSKLTIQSGQLHKGEAVILAVTNVLGEIVMQEKRNWINNSTINTENLSQGIYLLKISSGSEDLVAKFVKQ